MSMKLKTSLQDFPWMISCQLVRKHHRVRAGNSGETTLSRHIAKPRPDVASLHFAAFATRYGPSKEYLQGS